jgi:hypothetical protein
MKKLIFSNSLFDLKQNIGTIAASCYVSFTLIANVLSNKIAILPVLNLSTDAGTIIYPLTFTFRDFIHKTLGKNKSRQIVILAGILNFVMVGFFYLGAKMSPDPSWIYQKDFENILMPVTRIVLASIIAQVISELIDTEIFSRIYKRLNDLYAVLFSNFVALIVDTLIFVFIAFWGNFDSSVLSQIILTNIILKLLISLFILPIIRMIPRQVEMDKI